MITKYDKFNENIKHLLTGPSFDEIFNNLKDGSPQNMLNKSLEIGLLKGVKYAFETGNFDEKAYEQSLVTSCYNGYLDIVKYLVERGTYINCNDDRPLINAVDQNHTDIVKYLVANGADYSEKNVLFNKALLHYNYELVKFFIDKGWTHKVPRGFINDYINNTNTDWGRMISNLLIDNKLCEGIKSLLVGPTKEEIWESFGYYRTFDTPEDFLLSIISGIEIRQQNNIPSIVYWDNNGKNIFEQSLKSKNLWVEKSIWSVLSNVFELTYDEIQTFITNMVKKYLNLEGFTPEWNG